MPTRTQDVLAAYAAHLRAERHASPHTIRGYLTDLRQFLAFAGAPGAVRPDAIRHWLRSLDGTAERTSIARKLAAVRGLFRFLADQKRLAGAPRPRRLPRPGGRGGPRGRARSRLLECARRAADLPERGTPDGGLRVRERHGHQGDATRAQAHLRDPPPRRGRRSACHPGAARPREPLHHAALHARRPPPADGRL